MIGQKTIFILIGAQASGKGTQGDLLNKKLAIPHISTGNLVRQKAKDQDDMAEKIQKIMKTGGLIDNKLILMLLKERLQHDDCQQGYVLDGYPRNLEQMEDLHNNIIDLDKDKIFVFYLHIDPDVIWQRVQGRLICSKCGKAYDVNLFPAKEEGICDVCGGKLIHRSDDKRDVIDDRYNLFLDQTLPVINYYKSSTEINYLEVNGEQTIEKIFKDIMKFYYD